jgi:hypothetical protein
MIANIGQFLWSETPEDRFRFQNHHLKIKEAFGKKDRNLEEIKKRATTLSEKDRIYYNSKHNYYFIDRAIRFKIKDLSEVWKNYKNSCMKRAYYYGITTVLTGVGTTLITSSLMAKTAASVSIIGPYVLLIIAGFAFFGCLILAGINGYRAFKADQEAQMFDTADKHPELKIANERKQAYQQGFLYAYERNLKLDQTPDSCLLPNEVEFLFKEYLLNYATAMTNRNPRTEVEQKSWLADWQQNNPLSEALFSYGASSDLKTRFETLRAAYTKWNDFGMTKQNIQDAIQQNWEIIEENRKKAIIPFYKLEMALGIELGKKIARTPQGEEKDKIFETLPTSFPCQTPITKSIDKEFNRQKIDLEKNFAAFPEKALENTIQLYKEFLIQAISMIESSHPFNSPQQIIFTVPSIENRDFLAEAKERFADNAEILAYLNTPTEDVELTG